MKKKKKIDQTDKYHPTGTGQPRFKDEKRRRVIVSGDRRFEDRKFVWKQLDKLTKGIRDPIIVTGSARGVDTLAERWAFRRGLNNMRFPVRKEEWERLKKAAGPIRNANMAKYAVEYKNPLCIAFLAKGSKGTQSMIDIARKYRIKLKIVKVKV